MPAHPQSALVYVNTLMLQDILGEPEWAGLLTPADRRGLTPLFWSHVRPYGEVNLGMATRLSLGGRRTRTADPSG
ncbi:Tn3 family transposase [Streptomyces sp. PSKA30]|uniref:Tn3 family transposase n=1 Tax=Streptomyces sp. PSKA30 TaxID=2874597 RepID=UPI0021E4B208|nr:Tn3 family transposase [Streptomyces sp. PSKA30]